MRRVLSHPVVSPVLALAILYLLLIQPNHPGAMTWGALRVFPLELPALILGLMLLGQGRMARTLRAALTGALVLIAVLKAADFGMFLSLSRGFNPVADLPLITAGLNLLSGTVGRIPAGAAVIAALAVAGLLVWAVWWAMGVWARLAVPGAGLRLGTGVVALVFVGLSLADIGRIRGWGVGFNPPGAAFTARLGLERVQMVTRTLADLRAFRTAAGSDPFAGADGLLDRIDRDVIVIFVESYGRTSHETPLYAGLHRATLEQGQAALAAQGLAMASGYLSSPTKGGQSWLAHSTFANGLWIGDQTRYRAALASGRQTLFHIAARSGFQTAAVMPQITMDWPEADLMGFDLVLGAARLGYAGLPFNWVTMPDQYTFAALDRLVRDPPGDRPRFIQIATGTSHAPWVPVPQMIPWEDVGDGRVFNQMALAGDPPDVVWRDRDRVRDQYRLAIDYALQNVLSYAQRHAGNPPLMIILGDHQAAEFVAQDKRRDVPIHVIGPPGLVALATGFAPHPGLLPPADAGAVPMDLMRDLILRAYSSGPLP